MVSIYRSDEHDRKSILTHDEYMEKMGFDIKDSGKREEFASRMVRDTQKGKVEGDRVAEGPMLLRWGEHLTKGAVKYPDVRLGVANWTLAGGEAEYIRFRKSAWRHFMQWWRGEADEDHAAAVFFNINGAEYVAEAKRLPKLCKEVKDEQDKRSEEKDPPGKTGL